MSKVSCIEKMIKLYNKSDYTILAYVIKINGCKVWSLIDHNLINDYKNAQHSLPFKQKNHNAEDYNFKSVYIFDIEKGENRLTTTCNLKDNNYLILAKRGRVLSNPVWKLIDKKLQDKYEKSLVTLKNKGDFYHASDYREKVVAIKHKISKEIMLIHCESRKIALKM